MWLEVTYQGLAAPTGLFADLELIGWAPPTIAPPPHDAIDWSRPDEETGERFTLRDYTVEAAVVQPPPGTASRGTWTQTERASHLAALARALGRHLDVVVDDPSGLVRPAVLPPPPPPASAPAPAVAAVSPAPRASSFEPAPDAAAVLVTAPIKPSQAPRAEDALVALGVTVVFDSQERVRTERYRGSTYETTVTELHLAAVVAPPQLDAVVRTLEDLGLPLTFAEIDDTAVAADPPAEPVDAEVAGPVPRRDVGLACVVALAEPRTAEAVAGVIRSLGLVDASMTPASRTEVSTYRGSRSERAVPTLRVEAWVPEPHARLVANHLAEATHLRVDDSSRLWIEPPPPVPDPAGPAAPAATDPAAAHPGEAGDAPAATAPDTAASVLPAPPRPAPARSTGPAALDPRALVRRPTRAFVDHTT